MEKKQKIDQTRKARVGAIGENMVVAKLMQQGGTLLMRIVPSRTINLLTLFA